MIVILLIVGVVAIVALDLFYSPRFYELTKPRKCKCKTKCNPCCKEADHD